mgnify:CR=1 FL=1
MLDIGTRSSDLVVVDGDSCWIRTFPIGGSDFTEAIAETFKLPYSKAERLKKQSGTSKYAKQIMQAMRPVFTDLLEGVQRSISFYENSHRGVKIETVLGVGSTFKIPGLRKFLGAQLGLNVARFDEFRRLQVEGRMASDFAGHSISMATAYGLALQGIGEAEIDANLAPSEVLRDLAWSSKSKGDSTTSSRASGTPSSDRTSSKDPPVDRVAEASTTELVKSNRPRWTVGPTSMGLAQSTPRPRASRSMNTTALSSVRPTAASSRSTARSQSSARRATRFASLGEDGVAAR